QPWLQCTNFTTSTTVTSNKHDVNDNINKTDLDIDYPIPTPSLPKVESLPISNQLFEIQKNQLLTSMDMLKQIQDAPMNKLDSTAYEEDEARYWAERLERSVRDVN